MISNSGHRVAQQCPCLFQAKFNKFGVKNRSYGFVYTRNATAVREYLDEVNKFFNSDTMKRHIQFVAI